MTIPNYITLFRILIVPFFYTALVYYKPDLDYWRIVAVVLFGTACVSDALDGFISRKWNLKSELGTFLDPLADKILLISAFIGLQFSALEPKVPLWILILVVFRDIFIVAGLLAVYFTTHSVLIKPNILGKITTFAQMFTIFSALMKFQIVIWFWFLTAALTVASGIVYIVREMKRVSHVRPIA